MRKGWRTFFISLVPAVILSWIAFILIGTLLSRVCLERFPFAISALNAIPFLLPPAIYFAIDRSLVRTLLILIAVAIPLAIAIPGMEGVPQRSKQAETMRRMRAIMKAAEVFAAKTNRYPDANSIADLERQLGQALPATDSWCRPFGVTSNATGYQIVSFGLDGRPDGQPYVYARTFKLEDDIVAKDGIFLRAPEGVRESP